MIKSIFTLSVCLIFMTQAFPQKDPVALEILDAMSTKYKNIPAFIADFNYIMENEEESIDEKVSSSLSVNFECKFEILFTSKLLTISSLSRTLIYSN